MREWIKKNINPPGMEKKNRGSIFSFLGRVFGIVRADSERAFNAFFPYLSDPVKLREHGKALAIPELPGDTEAEYRDRVTAASFYLMRAGERAYIQEQLQAHFGDKYLLKEEFLQVYINLPDLNDKDRQWARSLLDGLLDPNIYLTVAEWFHFIDEMIMSDDLLIRAGQKDIDTFAGSFICNGQFYCDQGKEILCDGSWDCDGSVKCTRFVQTIGTISDYMREGVCADGRHVCNGEFDCSGYKKVYAPKEIIGPVTLSAGHNDEFSASTKVEPMEDWMQIQAICDGSFLCDGSNAKAMADGPMRLRTIKLLHCDGTKAPSCSVCDGSIICDGSYTGYDGLYYSGDIIQQEEILW
jgi:hypothetical protein